MAAKKTVEIQVQLSHRPGSMAAAMEVLAQARVNILAFCGYGHAGKNGQPGEAHVFFVVDKPAGAKAALRKAGYKFKANPVVIVTTGSGRGAAAKIARAIADAGVNLEYVYASTSGSGKSTAVFAAAPQAKLLKAARRF